MKGIMLIMLSLALAISCVNEVDAVPEVKRFDCFTASLEGNTKTVLNSNMTIGWIEGDEVAINDGTDTWRFSAQPSSSSNRNATLSPTGDENLSLSEGNTYYALYPYDEHAVWEGGKVTFEIPSSLVPKAYTFPYNPSVSSTTTSSIKFYNICSLIKFSLISDSVYKVVIKGLGGEYLAGEVTVDCADTTPEALITDGKGICSVTLEGDFSADTDYYVTVLPSDFKNGIAVSLYNKDGKVMTRASAPFNLTRSSRV